jgi:hypothetical protein
MRDNSELIQRVKRISLELPIFKGEFNNAVETSKSVKAVESVFNTMSDYCNALADELVGRGPACTKLAVALRGGFDIPEPYAFIFDAIAELESAKEPTYDPFELHHDRMAAEGATRPQIAQAWFDSLPPDQRVRLSDTYGGRLGAVKKITKDIDNLRRKQNRRP